VVTCTAAPRVGCSNPPSPQPSRSATGVRHESGGPVAAGSAAGGRSVASGWLLTRNRRAFRGKGTAIGCCPSGDCLRLARAGWTGRRRPEPRGRGRKIRSHPRRCSHARRPPPAPGPLQSIPTRTLGPSALRHGARADHDRDQQSGSQRLGQGATGKLPVHRVPAAGISSVVSSGQSRANAPATRPRRPGERIRRLRPDRLLLPGP
jgi:hypothetical protein